MNSGDRIRVRAVLPPMLAGRTGRVTGSTGRGTLVALDEPPEGFGRVCLFDESQIERVDPQLPLFSENL